MIRGCSGRITIYVRVMRLRPRKAGGADPDAVVHSDGAGMADVRARLCSPHCPHPLRAIRAASPMLGRGLWSAVGWCLLACLVGLVSTPDSRAQSMPQEDEEPLVERVTFEGDDALPEAELRASIETQETSCAALLLQPFCWVVDWSFVVDHRYLDRQELERDVVRLRVLYFRRGYREASVSAELVPRGEGVEVAFLIDEGEPTLIDEMEVRQAGDVLSERTIRRAQLPGEGDALNLDAIDFGMVYLEQQLGASGYLDATVNDSVTVDRSSHRADLAVVIEPGRRSTLRELDISGNEDVTDDTIREGLRLKRGRVLRVNDVLAARRSLYESNLFHEVDVTVPAQPDSAKRVEVVVREAPPRSARIGGGFNTIEFVQFEARFTHYDWLGAGRRLDLRATVGNLLAAQLNNRIIFHDVLPENEFGDDEPFLRPTWQVSVGFMQPAFQSAENVLGVELFANRRTIPGIVIDQGYGANVSLTRRYGYDTQLSLSYAFELTSVESGDLYFCINYGVCNLGTIEALRGRHIMSPVSAGLLADHTNSPLAPTSGYRVTADVEHASAITGSQFRYNRVAGEAAYYWPLDVFRRRVVAGRVRVGWVQNLAGSAEAVGVGDSEEALLHPRKRFYAGGSRSVRGFGENQLGPRTLTIDPAELLEAEDGCTVEEIRSATCDPHVAEMEEFIPRPNGGTTLLEASVEYRFPLMKSLTGAVFVDGAIVGEGFASTFSDGSRAVTPGIGVRFTTPVGPVRIDLGFRPNTTERLPVVTEYVDENGEGQLVELDARRSYNAVEAAGGGFLDEIFSRLALHLSIGEAF